MSNRSRAPLIGLVVVLFVFVAVMQNHLDPLRKKYQPGKVTNVEIGAQFIAATLIGLREVVAGLLWVRADSFFHTGNYEAVVPIVRIVTWLDPHQIDVYDTGYWHISYNFTDSQERSDRRYIPPAKALLREGIRNNPDVYDLYFSMGWLNFNKILDFPEAAKYFAQSNTKRTTNPETGKSQMRPQFVGHTLAHALEKSGKIDESIAQWKRNVAANEEYVRLYDKSGGSVGMVDVANNNLNQLTLDKENRSRLQPTVDANFEAHWQPISARKFRVYGTLDLPTGVRVRLRMTDKDFKEPDMKAFSWQVDPEQTILIDDLYVRDGKFSRTIDIERDAAIYPLKQDEYIMKFEVDPLKTPDEVQDAIGWYGNGLKKGQKNLVKEGDRYLLRKVIHLKRNQLM